MSPAIITSPHETCHSVDSYYIKGRGRCMCPAKVSRQNLIFPEIKGGGEREQWVCHVDVTASWMISDPATLAFTGPDPIPVRLLQARATWTD